MSEGQQGRTRFYTSRVSVAKQLRRAEMNKEHRIERRFKLRMQNGQWNRAGRTARELGVL